MRTKLVLYSIYPKLYNNFTCPECKTSAPVAQNVLFQGIHILIEYQCNGCNKTFLADLPLSQMLVTPFTVGKTYAKIYGEERAMVWFGKPLLHSLKYPSNDSIGFIVEKLLPTKKAVLINCLDFLYGHSLLKLFNADFYLSNKQKSNIILLIPQSLRWLVPEGIAEVWTVDIPFSKAYNYYPALDACIKKEIKRFSSVHVAGTVPHPRDFNIQKFSRVATHDFSKERYRITFIWRDNRLWTRSNIISKVLRGIPSLQPPFRWVQNFFIRYFFSLLKKHFPSALFTVAGSGTKTLFPKWVEDKRFDTFSLDIERNLCQIYSESRLIVGVHGSNLLLPSAHGGIVIDLMPSDRWGNIAQDIVFNEEDVRHVPFRYRFLPQTIRIKDLLTIAVSCLRDFTAYRNLMHDSRMQKSSSRIHSR